MSPPMKAKGISCKSGISSLLVVKLPCNIGPMISHPSPSKYNIPKLTRKNNFVALMTVCKYDLPRVIDYNADEIVVWLIY